MAKKLQFNKTVKDLIIGELYQIDPSVKIFPWSNNLEVIKQTNMAFVFLIKFKSTLQEDDKYICKFLLGKEYYSVIVPTNKKIFKKILTFI